MTAPRDGRDVEGMLRPHPPSSQRHGVARTSPGQTWHADTLSASPDLHRRRRAVTAGTTTDKGNPRTPSKRAADACSTVSALPANLALRMLRMYRHRHCLPKSSETVHIEGMVMPLPAISNRSLHHWARLPFETQGAGTQCARAALPYTFYHLWI